MSSLLRLEHKQKYSSNAFRIRIFLFRSYSSGIDEMINTFGIPVVSSKTIPDSRPKCSKFPFSDQNGVKTLPDVASHADFLRGSGQERVTNPLRTSAWEAMPMGRHIR